MVNILELGKNAGMGAFAGAFLVILLLINEHGRRLRNPVKTSLNVQSHNLCNKCLTYLLPFYKKSKKGRVQNKFVQAVQICDTFIKNRWIYETEGTKSVFNSPSSIYRLKELLDKPEQPPTDEYYECYDKLLLLLNELI